MYSVTSIVRDEETGEWDEPFTLGWKNDRYDKALDTYHQFLRESLDTDAIVIWSESDD